MRQVTYRVPRGATLLVAIVLLAVSGAAVPVLQTAPQESLTGLEGIFSTGPVLQDRNGDEVVDFVEAAIVLGEAPTAQEVAAAADIAARLGHETMAMNVPVASEPGAAATGILVGNGAVARAGLRAADAGVQGLSPGEGVVRMVSGSGRSWVVVAGADDAGTRAAADAFAQRLPHVWDPKGPELSDVAQDVETFLGEQGVRTESSEVAGVRVKAGEPGFRLLEVEVQLGSASDLNRARGALEELVRARPGVASGAAAPLSYPGARVLRVALSAQGADAAEVEVPKVESVPTEGPIPPRPGSKAKVKLDLSSVYTNDGFLGDSDENLIPDRIDVLLSPSGEGIEGTVDLAARIGLESAGVQIPVAQVPEAIEDPEGAPTLVLIGTDHPLVQQLVQKGKLQLPSLEPNQGLIQVVPKAFKDKSAVVITGGDGPGVAQALRQVAERFPNVWERGKDRTTIEGVEENVYRFLSGRSPAGQAATALYKLDSLVQELSGKDLESAHVVVSVEKPADGLEGIVRQHAEALGAGSLEVTIDNRDVENAAIISEEEFEVASEVAEFWEIFRSEIVPEVRRGQPVVIEARLSEPPEIRTEIEAKARAELIAAGAAESGTEVRVLSAYKQGYSWLHDVVGPALKGQKVGKLTIRFAENGPPPEWKQQAMYAKSRWLMETYPIDEVLARQLDLDLDQIGFEMMPIGAPTYEAIATAPDGSELLRENFEPKYVLRSYFDPLPDYEKVRVTTGWLTARVGGDTVVDRRIITDVERFWDHYQEKTLQGIYDYVMELTEGNPRSEDAPHFGKLVVELTLSEPNYLVGVDREIIASMESVHEDLYFATLHFFDVLGQYARGEGLDFPGRVIPIMRPKGDGKAGRAKITFTGFASPRPAVVVKYTERGGGEGKVRRDIRRVDLERPQALAATVRDGRDGIERLELRVKVDTEMDQRAELLKRARVEEVDRRIMSAQQVTALVDNLSRLQQAGLYRDALAYHDLGELRIAAGWEYEVEPATQTVASLQRNGSPPPFPDITTRLPAGWRDSGQPLVQWDTPIPPDEAFEILAKMSTFPETTVYKLGESYLGKDIWAMDLMPPIEASHWSHAKATTLKPTIIYSAREHANEISSTSHVLKLTERLLTDEQFRQKLNKANVVVHPITNPDGAQLAYDLYEITPDFMLHAGYLGALGVGVQEAHWDPDPIYPESHSRPKLWRKWLPDIYLSPHGYPHHEWVQMFSEYAAWVRKRTTESHDWWATRGWYANIRYIEDPKYPRHKEAAFEIREKITQYISAEPEVMALNRRAYDRYRRWGVAFDPESFRLDFTNGVLAYTAIKGVKAGEGNDFMNKNPKVTIYRGGTEGPDETAYGDWLKVVATAGFQFDRANLDYLVEGNHVVERKSDIFFRGIHFSMHRARPPEKKDEPSPTTSDRP